MPQRVRARAEGTLRGSDAHEVRSERDGAHGEDAEEAEAGNIAEEGVEE